MKRLFMLGMAMSIPLSCYALDFSWFDSDDSIDTMKAYSVESKDAKSLRDNIKSNSKIKDAYAKNISIYNESIKEHEQKEKQYRAQVTNLNDMIARMDGRSKAIKARVKSTTDDLVAIQNQSKKQKGVDSEIEDLTTNKKIITKNLKANKETLALLEQKIGIAQKDSLKGKKGAEKERLELIAFHANFQTQINADEIALAQNKTQSEKLKNLSSNLEIEGIDSVRIKKLQVRVDTATAIQTSFNQTLASTKISLINAQKNLKETQGALEDNAAKIVNTNKLIQSRQTDQAKFSGRLANIEFKSKLSQLLNDGDTTSFKAEMMFRSLDDITNDFAETGANKAFMLDQLKNQIEKNLDKTAIGQYVQGKIAAAACVKRKQCDLIESAGIDSDNMKDINTILTKKPVRTPGANKR